MLTRLIYASEAAAAMNPESVQALLERARAANQQREITGLLAFDSQVFMQVLEGPREQVSALFLRIAADRRHARVVVLDARAVDERHFGAWSMAFAAADAEHKRLYLRYGSSARFDPFAMTMASALALLQALTPPR